MGFGIVIKESTGWEGKSNLGAMRTLTAVSVGFVGWLVGGIIKQEEINKEMDKKAAKILFGDRISKERDTTTERSR